MARDIGEDEVTNELIDSSTDVPDDESLTFKVTVNGDFKIDIYEPSVFDNYVRLMLQHLADEGEIPLDDYIECDDIVFTVTPGFSVKGVSKK